MLHRGPQHPHPHRQQQQLQRDVGVHARPEGGADAGQQTRGVKEAHKAIQAGQRVVPSHFTQLLQTGRQMLLSSLRANHVFAFLTQLKW